MLQDTDSEHVTAPAARHKPIPKIERYKWTLKDSPGRFAWINKHELQLDPEYQRQRISEPRIRAIASEFSWVAFGTLSVAHRDGDLFIMDGGHRWKASKLRIDIDKLPCMIFETMNQIVEAQGFIDINVNRRAVGMSERWNAMIIAGDSVALKLRDLIAKTGHFMAPGSSDPKAVQCVHSLYTKAKQDWDRIARLWPVIVQVCSGNPISQRLIFATFYVEGLLAANNKSLAAGVYLKRLLAAGYDEITTEINRVVAIRGQAGDRACAEGLLEILNFRVREENRIELK